MMYRYKAVSMDGRAVKGVVEAASGYDAAAQVREMNQIVTRITPVRNISRLLSKEIGPQQVDFSTLAVLCAHFSMLLRSGMPVTMCMELITPQLENRKIKRILEEAREIMDAGYGLADSLGYAQKSAFSQAFLEMVRAGEKSGTLERSFQKLGEYYEKRHRINQKLSAAMTYPMVVLATAVAVAAIVMGKVLPSILTVFEEMEGELPLSTKLLMAVSGFCQNHLLHGLACVLAMTVAVLCWKRTKQGREIWSGFQLKIPIWGKLRLYGAAGHFANTVSAMIGAGMTLPHALDITARTLENDMLARETFRIAGKLEEGQSLGECMREGGKYPAILNEVCAIGEKSGELEAMLSSIGDYFDNRVDDMSKKAAARLEPAILMVLACLTGFLVISIYLPLFTMYSLM